MLMDPLGPGPTVVNSSMQKTLQHAAVIGVSRHKQLETQMRSEASTVSPTTRRGTTSLGIAREHHDAVPDEFRGGALCGCIILVYSQDPWVGSHSARGASPFNVMAMVTRCAKRGEGGTWSRFAADACPWPRVSVAAQLSRSKGVRLLRGWPCASSSEPCAGGLDCRRPASDSVSLSKTAPLSSDSASRGNSVSLCSGEFRARDVDRVDLFCRLQSLCNKSSTRTMQHTALRFLQAAISLLGCFSSHILLSRFPFSHVASRTDTDFRKCWC